MANTFYSDAGLSASKLSSTTPTSGVNTFYSSAGLSASFENAGNTGTIAQTTAPATQSLTGKSTNYGAIAQTVQPATQALEGKVTFKGTIDQTAAPATQALTGTVDVVTRNKKLAFNPFTGTFDWVQNLEGYLPYVGASTNIKLNTKNLTTSGTVTAGDVVTDAISTGAAAADLTIDCGTGKTLVLAEPVYDDLRTPVSAVRLSGSQPPTSTLYKGSEVLAFPHNASKTIYFEAQLPHGYKHGTDIDFHIHYVLQTAGADTGTAENVKFDFTYTWANIGDAFAAETPGGATIDVQSLAADTHYVGEIESNISGTGKTLSSMILCSLTRDTTVANNYAANVYLLEVDFHYQIDTLGSRQEVAK